MRRKTNESKAKELDILSKVQTPIAIINKDWSIKFLNDYSLKSLGMKIEDVVGKKCYDLFQTEHCQTEACACRRAIKDDMSISSRTKCHGLGDIDIQYYATPLRENGEIVGCVETIFDITEVTSLQQETIQMAKEMLEMSTPIVPILDDILIVPLIGTLDSQRTQQVTENLLQYIVEEQARVTVVDITGISVVDTLTASHLIKTAKAVSLLGGTAIITGISPKIAQILVGLGIDLTGLKTCGMLSEGITIALKIINKRIVDVE